MNTSVAPRRRRRTTATAPSAAPAVKSVIGYARLSVSTEAEISSIEAQTASIRAFVACRQTEGWALVEPVLADNGYSGKSADDRPALQQALRLIEAGGIAALVVVKVDRVSRSLRDWVRIVDICERAGTAFVSVTQSFDSSSSSGRLTLNILASFGEFERTVISERTREKIAYKVAKLGHYHGSRPTLGFRLEAGRLVIVPEEAERVRAIVGFYLEHNSVLGAAEEANRRGWRTKSFTRRDGSVEGGLPWSGESVHRLITNATIAGFVSHNGKLTKGVHEAIVDESVWKEVQATLRSNNAGKWKHQRRPARALLQGFLTQLPHSRRAARHFSSLRAGELRAGRRFACHQPENRHEFFW